MIISIGGTPGSGKSSVGKILSQKLGMKRYYMGQILRDIAKDKGLTIQQYLKTGEDDPSVDKDIDTFQKELGVRQDNFIIEGRTSFLMIPHSVKIFLKTDIDTAAKRIFKDIQSDPGARNEGEPISIEHTKEQILKRMRTDTIRYRKYYSIDVFDQKHFDIVIDTTDITPEQISSTIIEKIRHKEEGDAR